MTVTEYRRKHPHCGYCFHQIGRGGNTCRATGKTMRKRTARKCPCYVPHKWESDKFAEEMTEGKDAGKDI